MKQNNVRIHILKTFYPHWNCHTAFNAFLPYFNRTKFNFTVKNVPMENGKILPSVIYSFLANAFKGGKIQEYKLNDFWAELQTLVSASFCKIDLIHFIDAEHSMLFLPGWFRRLRYLKTVPKIIGMFHQPPEILQKIINPEIAGMADHILTVAPQQADFFAQFVPAERISTILLGVDTEYFKPVVGKKETGKFICLSGGVWLRDYEAVFETARLLKDVPEIEFHIVSKAIRKPENMNNIVLHHNISDNTLMDLYQNSHILFMPMKNATANTFLLEGCACGLPIVSTFLPSIKVYFPGDEAVLIKDNDPRAFVNVLTGLYHDHKKLALMSQWARQRALQLSWDIIVKEYEQLYMRLCGL